MQILLYTDSDVYAGTESHIFTLAQGLRALQVDVAVACPTPSPLADRAAAAQIEVIAIAKSGLIDRAAISRLAGLLKTGQAQIVHTHNGRTHLNAAIARSLAGRGHLIATQHFIEPNHAAQHGLKARLFKQAHRWVNRRTSHFVAISEAVKSAMLARGEAPSSAITIVPNGIAPPDTRNLASPEAVRASLCLPPQARLIVCAARLEREKDIASLIDAMPAVVQGFPDVQCLVAGQGAEQPRLQEQIRSLNLESRVRLLGFRADALDLIRASDLFVLPSLAEPFGLVLLEAMALGRPIVATRAGGPLEIVVDGETGLLVPPAGPPALAQAILHLLEDPETARKMGQKGRARYESHYTAAKMATAMQQVYHNVSAK